MFRDRSDRWFASFRRSGDPRALAHVFDRTAPELWRVARHLCRDRSAAEDAVQATYLSAIEARDEWDAARPVLPWLLGLLANRVREERRANARRPEPQRVAAPRGERDPADDAADRELDATLHGALREIAEPYRSALEQHLVHGLSAAEIAARGGDAHGTVRMRLHRGLDQLRGRLPKGLFAGGASLLLLSPEALAAMRTAVLTHAQTTVGAAGVTAAAGAAAAASPHGKHMLLALAALLLAATTIPLATHPWSSPPPARGSSPATATATAQLDEPAATSHDEHSADERADNARVAATADTGRLRVTVLTRGALDPVPGASIRVFAGDAPATVGNDAALREGTTDADGVATFELPAGSVRIVMYEPSPDTAAALVSANGAVEQVLFAAIPFDADVRVVDASGAAVGGANVVARTLDDPAAPETPLGATGADGHWRGRLPCKAFVVRAQAHGRASSMSAVLRVNRTNATLQLGGEAASVAGTVRDRDGRPFTSAGVALQHDGDAERSANDACRVARSDDDGRFVFDHVAAGPHTVYAWSGDGNERRVARAEVAAVAGHAATVDVTFAAGACIDVELVRADGRPWADATFHASAEEQPTRGIGLVRSGRTDANGRVRVDGLLPGRWWITMVAEQDVVREAVELREGEELVFRRTLGGGTWLEVRLIDPAGEPLRNWLVATHAAVSTSLEHDALWPRPTGVQTDEHGIARFHDVPGATTWVSASRNGTAPVVIRQTPTGERTTIVLAPAQLAQRRVTGRVTLTGAGGGGTSFTAYLIPLPEKALLFASGPSAPVGADGAFRFDAVPPGNYGLSIAARDGRGSELGRVAWHRGISVGERDVDVGTLAVGMTDVDVTLLRRDGGAVVHPRFVRRLADGHPFDACAHTEHGNSVRLSLPAGSHDVLALGDDCAPQPARLTAPALGGSAVITVEPAATVTVRCQGLPPQARIGEQRVLRGGRTWFSERVRDGGDYRVGLPPGTYRIEFAPDDQSRGARWAADVTVASEPVVATARRAG